MPQKELEFDSSEISQDEAESIIRHEMERNSNFNVEMKRLSTGGARFESSMHSATVGEIGDTIIVNINAEDDVLTPVRDALEEQAEINSENQSGMSDSLDSHTSFESDSTNDTQIETESITSMDSDVQATVKIKENGDITIIHSDGTEREITTLMGVFIGNNLNIEEMYLDEGLDDMLKSRDVDMICRNIRKELESQIEE